MSLRQQRRTTNTILAARIEMLQRVDIRENKMNGKSRDKKLSRASYPYIEAGLERLR